MALDDFEKTFSYCMIKPLDYTKFRNLINQVMSGDDEKASQAFIANAMQPEKTADMHTE